MYTMHKICTTNIVNDFIKCESKANINFFLSCHPVALLLRLHTVDNIQHKGLFYKTKCFSNFLSLDRCFKDTCDVRHVAYDTTRRRHSNHLTTCFVYSKHEIC